MAFVRANGLVLESARGPVPNLAQFIAGERILGKLVGTKKTSRQLTEEEAISQLPAIETVPTAKRN